MDINVTKPKSFGEILDSTFRTVKQHFSSLFLIMLMFVGPYYIIQLVFMLLNGTGFFRSTSDQETWLNLFEDGLDGMQSAPIPMYEPENPSFIFISFLLSLVLFPVAVGSIILALEKIHKKEEWKISQVVKKAFSRYFPLLGSSLIYALIIFLSLFVIAIIAGLLALLLVFIGNASNLDFIVVFIILVPLAFYLGLFIVMTKLGFYFAAVTCEEVAPGISKSWKLTRGRFWATFGLFIVMSIITFVITVVVQVVMVSLLGSSVVTALIVNLTSMLMFLVFIVAYAHIYFDLKVRNEAEDLKDMISTYKNQFKKEDNERQEGQGSEAVSNRAYDSNT